MINPAEIPQIPGNMGLLAGHAQTINATGSEFADTGQAVDTTWQGLATGYEAPEAAQLFAATGPVATVSASVGEDIRAVGAALAAYASEVKEINQLASLTSQAEQFVGSVQGDDDWRDDEGKVGQHNGLLSAVNAQVAAFFEAQRKCANALQALFDAAWDRAWPLSLGPDGALDEQPVQGAINALYGGRQYRADNGDGRADDGEFGFTADMLNAAAGEDGALPWGSSEEHDRGFWGDVGGFFGGIGEGFVTMLEDLGALIGRDPEMGEWSWGTAWESWKGLGTFLYAVSVYTNPASILLDQTVGTPFMERGGAGDLLLGAGKSIIAYDTWGEDKSKAAGLTTFNIVSAVVGTKGAGAGLRGTGAALNGVRGSATAARLGAGAIRAGNWLDNLPTAGEAAINLAKKFDIKIPNFGGLVPSFAGDMPPGGFRFDVELPSDRGAGPMHMDAGPSGNGPSGKLPDGSTPGGHPPVGNLPADPAPSGNLPGDQIPDGNLPGDNSPGGAGNGAADRGRDLTSAEQKRFFEQAGRLRPAERLGKIFNNPELPAEMANQAVRDFMDLQDSGRLAGSADRQARVLRDLLDRLSTTMDMATGNKTGAPPGAAAELRAAIDVLNSPDLKPGSKIGINVENELVDLGTEKVIRTDVVPEADLLYETRDGKLHLDEVKATAQAVVDKINRDPDQLRRMLEWRAADSKMRVLSYRIGTDQNFTDLFSETGPERQMAIDRLADKEVSVQIGGRMFTPEQLQQLRAATEEALLDPANPMRGKLGAWFEEHMSNLDAARDFLRPYGVDFL